MAVKVEIEEFPIMRNTGKCTLACLLLAGMLVTSGCGDDPAAPAASNTVDASTAEEFAVQALDMINGMAADMPSVLEGDFTQGTFAKIGDRPRWDPDQMAWVLDVTTTVSEGDPPTSTGETRFWLWIQFRNEAGPLATALGATEVEYRAGTGMTMEMNEDGAVARIQLDMATNTVATYRQDGGYDMDGSGDASVAAFQSSGGTTERVAFAMAWGLDMVIQPEGCPAGTAWVDVAPYRMDAVYDGQGNAAWEFSGPDYAAEGMEMVACGQPQ